MYITSLNPHTWMRWVLCLLILYVSLIRSQYPHIWVLCALCHKYGSPSSGHWKRSILIPIPKKGSTKECPNHQTIALICHASKVMLKILHTRLQSVSSVAQSCPTLWPHGLQHTRLPCPWPTPRAYSNSCPLYQWCHSTISPSVIPFSSRFQSFPASGSFQISQFFTSGGQNIGVSASASVLPMNIQDWFPFRWTGWISLQSKGLKSLFQHHSSKASILQCSAFFNGPTVTSIRDYWENHSFD